MARSPNFSWVLIAAAFYNMIWGASVVLFPEWFFSLAGMQKPSYPEIWQCVGMIVGVYGVGYFIAAFDPIRHWPIVLVGLLGKIFGPIGFVGAVYSGSFTLTAGLTILTNDLIWWVPFSLLLWKALKAEVSLPAPAVAESVEDLLTGYQVQPSGETLAEASYHKPLFLVGLRHFGCTFCIEALNDLRQQRSAIESKGVEIVLLHNADEAAGDAFLKKHGWGDVLRVSDPECRLYAGLGLRKGTFLEVFGLQTIVRGIRALVKGNGVGKLEGDALQMPGMFLIYEGSITKAFRHRYAGELPRYIEFASLPSSV